MANSIMKSEFGQRFRHAREALQLSRASLGNKLGISPKTIQSWEMGRTFIEDLSLVPRIEEHLKTSFVDLIGAITLVSEAQNQTDTHLISHDNNSFVSDPISPQEGKESTPLFTAQRGFLHAYACIPLIKPSSASSTLSELHKSDIIKDILIPSDWCRRNRILVAYRTPDSTLSPALPLGSTVIVDRRVFSANRLRGKFAAIWLHDRGLRIRKIRIEAESHEVCGDTLHPNERGMIHIRKDQGDLILGPVVGVQSKIH